jgi:hypothetical protein
MTNKKRERTTSKVSKSGRTTAEGSGLADDFLAYLNRSWAQRGSEFLDRVYAEQPKLYFKALVKLTQVLDRGLGEPMDFDRRRNREEVMQRLTRRDD